MPRSWRAAQIFAFALVGLFAAGSAQAATSIKDIVDHPDAWKDAQVTVVGTVVAQTLGYKGQSFYTLSGDGRRIGVVSPNAAPNLGDRLQVSGQVGRRTPDDEFDFPPVLVESARQTAP